jgi:hypothetical protein
MLPPIPKPMNAMITSRPLYEDCAPRHMPNTPEIKEVPRNATRRPSLNVQTRQHDRSIKQRCSNWQRTYDINQYAPHESSHRYASKKRREKVSKVLVRKSEFTLYARRRESECLCPHNIQGKSGTADRPDQPSILTRHVNLFVT